MSYLSLYRRRRPLTFADMTGQEHITRTLSNVLLSGRPSHAYLFCGPRGTGKTSAAKIFARAMNCADFPTDEPCGKCSSCENIAAGVSIDVIEMDAASNRGIEEIRELRERSRYASGESRFKIYIIDEAHMLTPEACNAFLKTLEEPPPAVVFVLATTDPSKLPSTIISRCQRFDFHLLTDKQIQFRLEQILEREKWEADEDALELIARLADGSLRDALGILEQCYAYGETKVTAEQVRAVTGATNAETVAALINAALQGDINAGLVVIQEVVYSGRDLNLFLRDLVNSLSRLLQDSSGSAGGPDTPGHETPAASGVNRRALLDAIELLHGASLELRGSYVPRYVMEVSFLRLVRVIHGTGASRPEKESPPQVFQLKQAAPPARPDSIAAAKDIISASASAEQGKEKASGSADSSAAEAGPGTAPDENISAAGPENRLAGLKKSWPGLLAEIKKKQRSTAAWLEPSSLLECRGNNVNLGYTEEYRLHQERVMENSHRLLTEKVLSEYAGEAITIKSMIIEEPGEKVPEDLAATVEAPAPETKAAVPKKEGQAPGISDGMEIFEGDVFD